MTIEQDFRAKIRALGPGAAVMVPDGISMADGRRIAEEERAKLSKREEVDDLVERIKASQEEMRSPPQDEPLKFKWYVSPEEAARLQLNKTLPQMEWPLDAPQPVKSTRTTKKDVLEAAIQTVADRGVPYGGVEDNFTRIARLWRTHILNRFDKPIDLTSADVAMMMVLMKVARLENQAMHPDSWIDIAGYAACGGEITWDPHNSV